MPKLKKGDYILSSLLAAKFGLTTAEESLHAQDDGMTGVDELEVIRPALAIVNRAIRLYRKDIAKQREVSANEKERSKNNGSGRGS